MKKQWWKVLGILILLYVFVAGLMVPLSTGISKVSPSSLKVGQEASLSITGYNANYGEGPPPRVWLKLDNERALAARSVEVLSVRELRADFQIPSYLPTPKKVQDFALIVDHQADGTSVLPSAVFITQDSIAPALGEQLWVNSTISDLHERWRLTFPFRNILAETIRNTYFHVPLWFGMVFIFLGAVTYSLRYLRSGDLLHDCRAQALTRVGILYGLLGLATGAIWAKNTWGAYWSGDVKQNMTAIALLIYLAYFILRGVFEDPDKRARISGVYSIFAFVALIPLIYVIPRLTDSLHPGAGGNPAFGSEDLDNTMRLVFYPAIIGWTLLGFWMAELGFRMERIRLKVADIL